jgi:hypothetical protein
MRITSEEANMVRFLLIAALLAAPLPFAGGEERKDTKAELKKAVEAADLIVVGKVTKTGLSVASSFDIGIISVSKVLKGDDKIKSVRFRFVSSGGGKVAPYGKVGTEGVWLLSGVKTKDAPRGVLSFQPLTEEKTVKALLKEAKGRKGEVGATGR